MQIWLNSLDIKTLTLADQLGLLYGVTTNPSLIAKSELNLEENIEAILKCHDKPIAIQVTAVDHAGIIEQAEVLSDLSERIIVKVPVTQEGLKAMHSLAHLRFASPLCLQGRCSLHSSLLFSAKKSFGNNQRDHAHARSLPL